MKKSKFTPGEYRLAVKRARTGRGLFALAPIPKGGCIIEYVGHTLKEEEWLASRSRYRRCSDPAGLSQMKSAREKMPSARSLFSQTGMCGRLSRHLCGTCASRLVADRRPTRLRSNTHKGTYPGPLLVREGMCVAACD
jgi:hypothetical protein